MAERLFDYANVSNIYKEMQAITGDSSNPDSIAGVLYATNKEVEDKVEVVDEAVYGDLGKQLQLDWDNTSDCFDDFINNFEKWSVLIAQSAGNYSEFEKRVNGLKTANPLGMTSNGAKEAYTNTGFYNAFDSKIVDDYKAENFELYKLTGADYLDIDISKENDARKVWAVVGLALDAVSVIGSAVSIAKSVKVISSVAKVTGSAKTAVGALHSTATLSEAIDDVATAKNAAQNAAGILEEAKRAGSATDILEAERNLASATNKLKQAEATASYLKYLDDAKKVAEGVMDVGKATEQVTDAKKTYDAAKALKEVVEEGVNDVDSIYYGDYSYLAQVEQDLSKAETSLNAANDTLKALNSGSDVVQGGTALSKFSSYLRGVAQNANVTAEAGEHVKRNMAISLALGKSADIVDAADKAAKGIKVAATAAGTGIKNAATTTGTVLANNSQVIANASALGADASMIVQDNLVQ